MVPQVVLQYVIVAFPGHTHLPCDPDQDRKNVGPDLNTLIVFLIFSSKQVKLKKKIRRRQLIMKNVRACNEVFIYCCLVWFCIFNQLTYCI